MTGGAGLKPNYPIPATRRFRVYAFDPLASTSLATAVVNDALISLPWEESWEDALGKGPVGEYLEVIDIDPASGLYYPPVDPTDPILLAQDGLPPSESRPQFHQQMVYAVAMKTIRHFERALGRKVLWSPREVKDAEGRTTELEYVHKLRVHPHGLRERNAYYSPLKKALLFGYFKTTATRAGLPDGWVFTCLSHDIIAHETTHAILDGMHARFLEPTCADTRAFHEAFADIVALLQHFTMPEVVEQQLAQVRGRLRSRSLLSGLAQQFGDATGRAGALREAITDPDDDAAAQAAAAAAAKADPSAPPPEPPKGYAETQEAHARGSFLVAALFDAFVTIFERRTADLIRLASATNLGGELHPDLIKRLTAEATKSADHLLRICVRALDYVPPIDLRFGEFLRAMITADADLIADDRLHYRLAIADAFRRRGIYPKGALSMAPDSLLWEVPDAWDASFIGADFKSVLNRLNLNSLYRRNAIWRQSLANKEALDAWLKDEDGRTGDWERLLGVRFGRDALPTIERAEGSDEPRVEVHSVRIARRAGPDGQDMRQLVVEILQRRRAFRDKTVQAAHDNPKPGDPPLDNTAKDFFYHGGCTLLVDLRNGRVRYVVRKRIDDDRRLDDQRRYMAGAAQGGPRAIYFGEDSGQEPFAMLHRD